MRGDEKVRAELTQFGNDMYIQGAKGALKTLKQSLLEIQAKVEMVPMDLVIEIVDGVSKKLEEGDGSTEAKDPHGRGSVGEA